MVFRRMPFAFLKSFNEVVNREAGVASLDDQHFHHVFQTFCLDADPAFPYKRSLAADGLRPYPHAPGPCMPWRPCSGCQRTSEFPVTRVHLTLRVETRSSTVC